ncbi:maleylacetoacetate isomerase [Chelativorans salis]|uniref:Maleylacetoacetate isomerase n=1 Tax=Chelativorans salis TaxID=2978478 RepID=A0ABT2LHZ1_9HYPH|nr:maleylacetoacetate isomerase [Chelativorans sp. EGI FJ00035]MCT7374197.1 maleylacetoacetate isomerase [Chelativorans sp. EGI FJ00035]
MATVLYDYWRSSASYRVRIALNMLGEEYEIVPVDLLAKTHMSAEHLARNPQGLVPALHIDGRMLTQSLAIIEYLEETRSAGFLPEDAAGRARVRALAYAIAMEIHPVCNTRVAAHIVELTGNGDVARKAWMQKFIADGLRAFEAMLDDGGGTGDFCHGDRPGMAEFCLVPQLYNARRWEVDLSGLERMQRIDRNCSEIAAFDKAHPDRLGPPPLNS